MNMIKKLYRNDKINMNILWICFILYIILFLFVVWFKFGLAEEIISDNEFEKFMAGEKPIEETKGYIFSSLSTYDRFMSQFNKVGIKTTIFKNMIPNILVTLAIGICLPLLFKKDNLIRDALIGLGITLIVEIVQLFSRMGSFELLDLFCNTLGVILGALFTKLMRKKLKETTFNKTVNISALVVTMIEIPLDIYLLVNIITNWNYYLLRLGVI